MDEPVAVGRRLVEIGDVALRGSAGVDGEMRAADKPLVSPDRAESVPVGKRKALGNRQLHSIGHQMPPKKSGPARFIITRELGSRISAIRGAAPRTRCAASSVVSRRALGKALARARHRGIRTKSLKCLDPTLEISRKQDGSGEAVTISQMSDVPMAQLWGKKSAHHMFLIRSGQGCHQTAVGMAAG